MRARIAVLAALCAGLVAESREPAPAPRAVPGFEVDEPPAHVARLIARARGTGLEADVAARELGATPDAEPFVRHALLRAPHPRLRAAHETQLDARDARNVARAKAWADAGRADLLVEAAVMARTEGDADQFCARLMELANATTLRATKARADAEGSPPKGAERAFREPFLLTFDELLRTNRFTRETGDTVRGCRASRTSCEGARWTRRARPLAV
jgi:hypothetical protein